MAVVKKGDQIKVHYTGRLTDGTVFDSSDGRDPLAFEVGAGMMIPGFDKAVNGMKIGDKKTAEISADEAYGQKSEEMIFEVPRANLPEDMEVVVGMPLAMQQPDGTPVPVTVAELKGDIVVIDANHDLAGKDLVFDIEIVEIG
jgi:peptidylprolyl isomerase